MIDEKFCDSRYFGLKKIMELNREIVETRMDGMDKAIELKAKETEANISHKLVLVCSFITLVVGIIGAMLHYAFK